MIGLPLALLTAALIGFTPVLDLYNFGGTGQPAPDFVLDDDAGAPFRLAAQRGHALLLAFYPKDFTPG